MKNLNLGRYVLLILTVGITAVLSYWSFAPLYILQIQTDSEAANRDIRIDKNSEVYFYKNGESLAYYFSGTLQNPQIEQLTIRITPVKAPELKPVNIPVRANFFSTSIDLATPENPISRATSFGYQVMSERNVLLAQGTIPLQVEDIISGSSPLFMVAATAAGLISSMLQIIYLVFLNKPKRAR